MRFGIFDHMDLGETETLSEFFENRLRLAELYDEIGIHAYHIAEHHGTPLGMSPSPNVFLSALAQRTKRLRFGPLVYCLPLYHPIRLLEEICMLDQMSDGRLEMGIGRGVSPIELDYYGLNFDDGHAIYRDTFDLITQGLVNNELTHNGEYFSVANMPFPLSAVQKPHPPLWYGIANPASTEWPAQNGLNVITNQTVAATKEIISNYKKTWESSAQTSDQLPCLGMTRYLVISKSKETALSAARRAYPVWRKSFMALWDLHGRSTPGGGYPETFDGLMEKGQGFAGTSSEVLDVIGSQIQECGINYFVSRFAFGNLTYEESSESIRLFAEDVMPQLSKLN